jgi:hypothetical protein
MDTKEAGRRGGLRRKQTLSKARLREIAQEAARARWAKAGTTPATPAKKKPKGKR